MWHRNKYVVISLISVWFYATDTMADDRTMEEITANWKCEWCPYDDQPVQGEVEGGLGAVSNDSYKFGDYTGLDQKGAYAIGDAELYYRGKHRVDLEAEDLGLDSRRIDIDSNIAGRTELQLEYSQIPKLNSDSARSPYAGDAYQRLPQGWVGDTTTAGMTELGASLNDVDIYTKRRSFAVSAAFHQSARLSYDVAFQRDTKKGHKALGLAFGDNFATARSAIVVMPVDMTTDQAQVKINYKRKRWQGGLIYQFSKFDNEYDAYQWDNAFSQPDTTGQVAAEPDNLMQQISLLGSYRIVQSTVASAKVSAGQLSQDQSYLPYTVNSNLTPANDLPRTSLDGKVNTFDFDFSINSRLMDNLNVEFRYDQHEQDNNTDRAAYEYVRNDTTNSTFTAVNFPYSFRQRQIELRGRYLLLQKHAFSLGFEHDIFDRTYQEVDQTKENTANAQYSSNLLSNLNMALVVEHSDRSGSEYQTLTEISPPENPLLRKYNMADRKQDLASASVSYGPIKQLDLDFLVHYANDDYDNSQVGLKESEEMHYGLHAHLSLIAALRINLGVARTDIQSTQAGMQTAPAVWIAQNDEQVNVANAGFDYTVIKNKLNIGLDYVYAESSGEISVDSAVFPEITTERHTIKLQGDYRLSQRSTLNAYYTYEKYDESDWAVDGVAPNSMGSVLTLGEVSPSYTIGFFAMSYSYAF
ncbi:MAG: MtrB/PioB family decaheme-associated outer membrane protein [Gammaproteobacteria bacterium]|nr:MtrB/PioB family decaheme-associated outer membrane protein [Gammaproteobacteria bacterium]